MFAAEPGGDDSGCKHHRPDADATVEAKRDAPVQVHPLSWPPSYPVLVPSFSHDTIHTWSFPVLDDRPAPA